MKYFTTHTICNLVDNKPLIPKGRVVNFIDNIFESSLTDYSTVLVEYEGKEHLLYSYQIGLSQTFTYCLN